MRRISLGLLYAVLVSLGALVVAAGEARADKIGGSALPQRSPALKGRISEDGGPSTAAFIGTAYGTTTNAGPTLLEVPSNFLERSIGFAHMNKSSLGQLSLGASYTDQHNFDLEEADDWNGRGFVSLNKDWGGQQTLLAFVLSSSVDIEERLTEAALSGEHIWQGKSVSPFVKGEVALLDYRDIDGGIPPFGNHDDRDRLSTRAELGLRVTLTEHVNLEVGGGADAKRYLMRYDDFGVNRDSISAFPLIGLSAATERGSIRAVYMPFYRFFREELFEDMWKHGYSVDGRIVLTDWLTAFASARYGFMETDFLIASSAYEKVALGGVIVTWKGGTYTFAVSETRRDYEGLDLLEIERDDRKIELAFDAEYPLTDSLSLTSRVSYMDYASSFTFIKTSELAASLGMTYAVAK